MKEILKQGFEKLNIKVSENQIAMLVKYGELLVEWNEKINLTAITEEKDIAIKHFLDCATCLNAVELKGKVIDVGTGAGFPGLVLKILKPEIELYLLDSLNKRLLFLDAVIKELGLENVTLIHARAEDGGRDKKLREKFDFSVSRAVANLATLSEYCLPFLKDNGHFVAMKGPDAENEVVQAEGAIKKLSSELVEIKKADIPFTDLKHCIVLIKKLRQISSAYPRKAGKPSKEPLK